MNTTEQIQEAIDYELAQAGDDTDRLRDLETFLESLPHHPLVRQALREVSSKIFAIELQGERNV